MVLLRDRGCLRSRSSLLLL